MLARGNERELRMTTTLSGVVGAGKGRICHGELRRAMPFANHVTVLRGLLGSNF